MNRVFILSHLGLGDNIFCISMINCLLQNYKVDYICKKRNLDNFQSCLTNQTNLTLIPIQYDIDAYKYIIKNKDLYKTILISGSHRKNLLSKNNNTETNLESFPFFQYDDISLPREILKQCFTVPETPKSEELFESVKHLPYIVVTNDSSIGFVFDIDSELTKYSIDPNNTLIINTQCNYYKKEHKFHSIAEPFVFQKLIDYKKTLINAEKILISDSSMFCLAIQLNLKSRDNNVYVRSKSNDWNTLLNFYDKKFVVANDI